MAVAISATVDARRRRRWAGGRREQPVRRLPQAIAIDVCDRGSGMSETVLSNALLP
jgi:hypothetical protein